MHSRGASFVFVLIALALVGGAVVVSNNFQLPSTNSQDILGAVGISARDTSTLAEIERQLTTAQKTRGISPSSYRSIESKLKAFEKKKIDTKKARTLMSKLEVGGTKNPPSSRSSAAELRLDTSFFKGGIKSPPPLNLPLGKGGEARQGYWKQWETEYKPVGAIPPCPDPLVIPSPVDVSKVTSILYPGQIRGEYKAHGGFRLDNQSTNEAIVRIPLDAEFIYGSRHYQSGEIQYLLGFRMPCGIEYRLDHLLTLSPRFQALVDKHLPSPKQDSFTTEVKPPVPVKAGEIVATEVGFRNTRNIGFDFGVYDLRKKNKKASDRAWAARHKNNLLAQYAICWLDYLSPNEQRVAKALPGADGKMGKTSDYCTNVGMVTETPTPSVESGAHTTGARADYAAIKGEIEDAERKNGRFSEEHSARVLRDLDSLEKLGVAKSVIERLRAIVKKHSPHLADEERALEEARKASAGSAPCANPPPTLTADITDFSKIRMITAPGSGSSEGPKGHSFIWTDGARVPVYAPIAGIYDSGSYSKDNVGSKAQYLLFFNITGSCGYQFKFAHIDEAVASIRQQLPPEPKVGDSRGTPATTQVSFKAGELIGYTSGNVPSGNWDFGLYNTKEEGKLAAEGSYGIHRYSVCWPDFFSAEKRGAYRRLLQGPELVCSLSAPRSETAGTNGGWRPPQPTAKTEGDNPPLFLKSIGVDLGYFDATTGRAGDFVFTKSPLQFNVLLTEFGFTIPANQSATGADKKNPQPTFILPLGTKVRALVDGIVVEVPTLYSGDYSIMVAPRVDTNWRYETEHVINPLVKVGDAVKAGQIIAEVSPHSSTNNSGYGLVEIGILKGGNGPQHLCPFAYLDPSIKDEVQKKLRAFYASWEEYRGDSTLHNEAAQTVPGCLTLDAIDG